MDSLSPSPIKKISGDDRNEEKPMLTGETRTPEMGVHEQISHYDSKGRKVISQQVVQQSLSNKKETLSKIYKRMRTQKDNRNQEVKPRLNVVVHSSKIEPSYNTSVKSRVNQREPHHREQSQAAKLNDRNGLNNRKDSIENSLNLTVDQQLDQLSSHLG
jgi:hypothetical protein